MRKIFLIVILVFSLNLMWENFHSFLYAIYEGGAITEFILARATLADTLMVFIIVLPFIFLKNLQKSGWLIIPIGVTLSVCIELWAIHTGRWAYNGYMPIIPLLSVGLTPAIQLGFIGYLSFWLVYKKDKDR